ncbi:FixH family protein [Methylobacterium nodulans]|uniref:FixH family protein n=1 Tax=Methylobacterium nodulans (strain LMG 21967 / CNCM I-2342 / ORS 2060) TaxID=460265 RepID=B8IN83_METNO|nr:FixH family protein [Methylobacterium nodulans]ACL62199.1 FixH family protein [Methylobacterium nodulans ORS 2060]
MSSPALPAARPLTGRQVLLIFVAFFGIIAAVNVVLVTVALRTWSGLDEASPYHAGQVYNAEIRLARAQAARGWQLAEEVTREGAGVAVTVRLSDRDAAPLSGLTLQARFERPTDKRQDVALALTETGSGTYSGRTEALSPGQWNLVVDVADATGRVFRRHSRVVLN